MTNPQLLIDKQLAEDCDALADDIDVSDDFLGEEVERDGSVLRNAADALRAVAGLAQPAEGEAVAWRYRYFDGTKSHGWLYHDAPQPPVQPALRVTASEVQPLYTHPPQQQARVTVTKNLIRAACTAYNLDPNLVLPVSEDAMRRALEAIADQLAGGVR